MTATCFTRSGGQAARGWVPDSSIRPRWPLFENGRSEMTIHADRTTQQFLAVQTRGFGPADVMMRAPRDSRGPGPQPNWSSAPRNTHGRAS